MTKYIKNLASITLCNWYTFSTGLFSSYVTSLFFCRVFVSTASYTFWVACPTLAGTLIYACCLNYESNVRENHQEHWRWLWFKQMVYSTLVSARHKAVTHLICGKNHNGHVTPHNWKWKIKSSLKIHWKIRHWCVTVKRNTYLLTANLASVVVQRKDNSQMRPVKHLSCFSLTIIRLIQLLKLLKRICLLRKR